MFEMIRKITNAIKLWYCKVVFNLITEELGSIDGVRIFRDRWNIIFKAAAKQMEGLTLGGDYSPMQVPTIWGERIIVFPRNWNTKFSERETMAVIYHEIGHCRHGHRLARNAVRILDKEMAADRYAIEHGYGEELISVLLKFREQVTLVDLLRDFTSLQLLINERRINNIRIQHNLLELAH